MAQYDRFIKKIATKLQQAAEKEMKDAAPKCPFFYYQPKRPYFENEEEDNTR